MRIKPVVIGLLSLALLGALVPQPGWTQSYPQSVADLIAKARSQVRTIDMAAFRSGLDKSDLGLIIDVREPAEYTAGHVRGAINIPRGLIEMRIWPYVGFPDKLDLHAKLTLYCGSGARAALAANSLKDLGLTDVTSVDMRFEDWVKAGNPVAAE